MNNTVNMLLAADPMRDVYFSDFGEALSYSISTSAFGMVVVFGVLALIWGILVLFRLVFSAIGNDKQVKQENHTEVSVIEEKIANTEISMPVQTGNSTDNSQIVAAIIAAISAFRSQNGEIPGSFRVVSFKKRK